MNHQDKTTRIIGHRQGGEGRLRTGTGQAVPAAFMEPAHTYINILIGFIFFWEWLDVNCLNCHNCVILHSTSIVNAPYIIYFYVSSMTQIKR